MIDCHCHLADKAFDEDLPAVVERARQAGVGACLVNTESQAEFDKALRLAADYPDFLLPCFGVHPVQYEREAGGELTARSVRAADVDGLHASFAKHHERLVAIGETGLDYTPRYMQSDGDKEAQRKALRAHADLSKRYDLPLICHSRSCGKPVIALLQECGVERALLHAFDGNVKSAQSAIHAGYYFSIPPSICRSSQKSDLVKAVPLEQLLLETDSPVLGPQREERNEPANLRISCEWIAKLKGVSVDDVARQTTRNALVLFPRLARFLK